MEALLLRLEPEFGTGKVFRPHRDLRFSKDKTPYKTHQGAFIAVERSIGYYVHIDAAGLLVAGGFHSHEPDQVERYRAAVDDERRGGELTRIVEKLTADGFELDGDRLKTRPRGVDANHPRLELLRYRSLTADQRLGFPDWLHTPAAADHVSAAWRSIRPPVASDPRTATPRSRAPPRLP